MARGPHVAHPWSRCCCRLLGVGSSLFNCRSSAARGCRWLAVACLIVGPDAAVGCKGLVVACLIVGLVLLEVVGGWQ